MRTSLTGRLPRWVTRRPSLDYLPPVASHRLDWLRARVNDQARELVALAAQRLDDVDPTWWRRVDRATLDLADPHNCLLAQVFGGYEVGLHRVHGDLLGRSPGDAAFTGRVSELLWFVEVDRRARDAAASDREFGCVAS